MNANFSNFLGLLDLLDAALSKTFVLWGYSFTFKSFYFLSFFIAGISVVFHYFLGGDD